MEMSEEQGTVTAFSSTPMLNEGMISVQKGICVNDDSTGDMDGDTCSSWYDENHENCGEYDDEDFDSSTQCCGCVGGTYITECPA